MGPRLRECRNQGQAKVAIKSRKKFTTPGVRLMAEPCIRPIKEAGDSSGDDNRPFRRLVTYVRKERVVIMLQCRLQSDPLGRLALLH